MNTKRKREQTNLKTDSDSSQVSSDDAPPSRVIRFTDTTAPRMTTPSAAITSRPTTTTATTITPTAAATAAAATTTNTNTMKGSSGRRKVQAIQHLTSTYDQLTERNAVLCAENERLQKENGTLKDTSDTLEKRLYDMYALLRVAAHEVKQRLDAQPQE